MKYILITLFSLILPQSSFSQYDFKFCIIRDNDSWVNVRGNNKNIMGQLGNNKLVYVFPPDFGDKAWYFVAYNESVKTEEGYVHESRLLNINNLKKLSCVKKEKYSYEFKSEEYDIKVSIEPFSPFNRTLKYSDDAGLEKIDGEDIWGVDGDIPKTQYKSIEITKNGTTIPFPRSALHNLFEPSLDNVEVYYDEATNNLYITSLNSDGAGGYVTAWTIENDRYKERLVSNGF